MRIVFFLLILLILSAGCIAQPTPTPVEIQQYPATWTPAPTPTNTPLPPTATLVIQHTPGPVATRDPNARILPVESHNLPGIWMYVSSQMPQALVESVLRANVIVTDGTGTAQHSKDAFVFLDNGINPFTPPLAPKYNGVVVGTINLSDPKTIRASIGNRLILMDVPITATTIAQNKKQDIDGVILENFLTNVNAPLNQFKSEADWKQDVDTLANWSSNNNSIVLTRTPLGTNVGDSSISPEQWLGYAFASFLIGANNTHSYFGFESATAAQLVNTPLTNAEIGTPLGALFRQNGVYQRRYTRGLVLVNPTNDTHMVALSRGYANTGGTRLNQVNLPPHSGAVLLDVE